MMNSSLSRKIALCIFLSVGVVAILWILNQPEIPDAWAAGFVVFLLLGSVILAFIEGEQQQALQRRQKPKTSAGIARAFVAIMHRTVYGVVIVSSWILILAFGLDLRFAPLSSKPLRVSLDEVRKPWERQKWVTLEGVAPLVEARRIGSTRDIDDEWVPRYYFCPLLRADHPSLAEIDAVRTDPTAGEEEKEERIEAIIERALEDTIVVLRHEVQWIEEGRVDLIAERGSSVTGILYDGSDDFVREVYGELAPGFSSEKTLLLYGGHQPEPLITSLLAITIAALAVGGCIWHWNRMGLVPPGEDESERKLGRTIVKVCLVLMVVSGLVVAKAVFSGYYVW